MNNFFQENRRNLTILLGLLFVLLIAVYILFYLPLSKDLKSTQSQVSTTEADIEILKAQIENSGGKTTHDDIERLRFAGQLPIDADTDEIILTLEEIEFISESRIDSISFSYDGSMPNLHAEEDSEDTETEETTEEINGEQEEEENEPVINMEEKPEDLHVITLNLSVTSPNYEKFQTFITEIEKQERMMMVSSMDFQKPTEEVMFEDDANGSITSNLTITTFHYGD